MGIQVQLLYKLQQFTCKLLVERFAEAVEELLDGLLKLLDVVAAKRQFLVTAAGLELHLR